MSKTEYIQTFSGQYPAIFEHQDNGDIVVRDHSSRVILGYYRAARNVTTDFYGKVFFRSNMTGALVKTK